MGSNFLEEEKIVEEIALRRSHVLQKFSDFEHSALKKRDFLVQSVQLQHFNRNADEVNQSIEELIEKAENVVVMRSFEQLSRTSKNLDHLRSSANGLEVNVKVIEAGAGRLVEEKHFAKKDLESTSSSTRQRWQYLMDLLTEKLLNVHNLLDSIEFCRKCEILLEWMNKMNQVVWTPETNRVLFDDIRKKAVIWNELNIEIREINNPTPEEVDMFENVKKEWAKFHEFVDSLMKELDEKERITQFLENAEDIRSWISGKEEEMHEKYSKMGLEESLKYRKTTEIELKTIRQRVDDLKKKKDETDSTDPQRLDEEVEKTEEKYNCFVNFVKKWMIDVENKAEYEGLMKEAEEIQFWCSEKMEDLKNMLNSESYDCDEIAMWIESNNFDTNSWDLVIESFARSAEKLLERDVETTAVEKIFREVIDNYDSTQKMSTDVNTKLNKRIETICIEELIYQTHVKASHLVQLLKNQWNCETSDQLEKKVRMIDGLAVRCDSVVEQINNVQEELVVEDLSPEILKLVDEMAFMKKNLKTSCDKKREELDKKLDVFYLFDSSEELKEHTSTMLHNLKTEIHKEARLKSSKNRIHPLKEQLDKILNDYEDVKTIIQQLDDDREWADRMNKPSLGSWRRDMREKLFAIVHRKKILDNVHDIRENIDRLVEEHDSQLDLYDVRRHVDDTAQFVERIERWVDDGFKQIEENETDSPLRCQDLRRIVSACDQLLSNGEKYKKMIEKRQMEAIRLDQSPDEVIQLLDNVETVLDKFAADIQQKIDETEVMIVDLEQMNELNGHIDWIKSKISFLSIEPNCDTLLAVQKLLRRYENDSEEIENRRKNINDIIVDVKKAENVSNSYLHLIDEIEKKWRDMKEMFDERGSFLDKIVKLFEYDLESAHVWEWIREKMMFVDSVERKEDEEINRILVKKMSNLMSEVVNFEPKVEEVHRLLEDALIQQSNENIPVKLTPKIQKFKSDLTKKQGDIESDFNSLKRCISKKSKNLDHLIQENEVNREILETERWIEEQEGVLNRMFKKGEPTEAENELESKLDDVETNLNRKRANLTDIKCAIGLDGANSATIQKIDDAFSMLDVFAFELDRMRQKVHRGDRLRKLKREFDDVIDSIQATCEKLEAPKQSASRRSGRVQIDNGSIDSEMESLKRRVVGCLAKAKEVRGANADLATQVYELEENMEKEWIELEKLVDKKQKDARKDKLVAELRAEIIDLEQWLDTFNEEIAVITGGIHDNLGVQVALESVDTWREEIVRGAAQLNHAKNLMVQVQNGQDDDGLDTENSRKEKEQLYKRLENVFEDFGKARKTIEMKNDHLIDFLEILHAERSVDRLHSWVVSKRKSLEEDFNNNQNAKTMIRKMGEIEKMMASRNKELDELKDFFDAMKHKPTTFEATEVDEKFEILMEEWRELEDDLKRREVDFNESISQLYVEEEFDKINQWIEKKIETISNRDVSNLDGKKTSKLEKQKEQYDTIFSEIREFQPIYEDFLRNEYIDDEKVRVITTKWMSLVETTTISRKRLTHEIEKNRIFEMLDSISAFITDSEADLRGVNLENMYRTTDCEKMIRKMAGLNEFAVEKENLLKTIRSTICAFRSQIGDEDVGKIEETIEVLNEKIGELKKNIKVEKEDLEMWKDMQEVVRLIDDELCWFKELSVMVSSSDVGQDSATLDVIRRKHQRSVVELERRKQKAAKTLDRAAEVLSIQTRDTLNPKLEEIDVKIGQMESLIENIGQLSSIRTHRLEKWSQFFELLDELKEKEHGLEHIRDANELSKKRNTGKTMKVFDGEKILAEIERNFDILENIGDQMEELKKRAEMMSLDEMIRTKTADNFVEKLKVMWNELKRELEGRRDDVLKKMEHVKFVWSCDLALQAVGDQVDRISNLVRQNRPNSNFENAQYHSTTTFIEQYTVETFHRLVETTKKLGMDEGVEERERKLSAVSEKLQNLKREVALLAEKINREADNKETIQKLQDEYTRKASELAIWIEQAEEDVADLVCFQTKHSTQECFEILNTISEQMNEEMSNLLGELELLEVELSAHNEYVKTFTWNTFKSLAHRMDKLTVTIAERMRIVEKENARHDENEAICRNAAELLQKCTNVIVATKNEIDRLPNLTLEAQHEKLSDLIEKLSGSGMIEELEHLRSLMDSRYIFENKFSKYTPNGVHIEARHCIELMSSMLRSVEHSMADRDNCGISDQQMHEFENSFDYFDEEHKGWLDYEKFELCMKSQGYDFVIEQQTQETLVVLDPARSGKVLKTNYMRWIIKNEKTNIYDDRQAIEDALKSLDTKKLSDSMSRKEADFFMRKIGSHTETYTEHVHLEYKDFVKSFY